MKDKPFVAILTDPTRSVIQGYAGNEFYRLERGKAQPISARVTSALRETLYEVTISGAEPASAKIAENKVKEGANNGNNGTKPGNNSNASKKDGKAKKEKTGTKAKAEPTEGNTGTTTEQ